MQDLEPRLPWWICAATQARVHAAILAAYGRHLQRLARASP